MQNIATVDATLAPSRTQASALSWVVLAMAVGATSIVVGVLWDISWHRTIGRDTFWTPAHMAIYLGGVLGGLGGGWLALRTTFGNDPTAHSAAVRFWGFRAPLGAWVAIWGAIAMLTSAPFDDWWHNAYGLDVKIISPPHMVLAMGMGGIVLGALLLALSEQNRGTHSAARSGFYLYVAGMLVAVLSILTMEYNTTNLHHGPKFYLVACLIYPVVLVAVARAGRPLFSATLAAGVYMAIYMLMIWILPLFKAQPMLGPIYNPVDYMVVHKFPILLILPALALDFLMLRFGDKGRDLLLALALGGAFFLTLLLVQWPFAEFLISPAAENRFFGSHLSWSYNSRPGSWQYEFWGPNLNLRTAGIATVVAMLSSWLGLRWGHWMSKVQRSGSTR